MVLFRFWAESGFVDLVLCEALENCAAKHEEKVNDDVSETRAAVEVMYESAWKDFRHFSKVSTFSFGSRNVNSCHRATRSRETLHWRRQKTKTKVKFLDDMVYRREVRQAKFFSSGA